MIAILLIMMAQFFILYRATLPDTMRGPWTGADLTDRALFSGEYAAEHGILSSWFFAAVSRDPGPALPGMYREGIAFKFHTPIGSGLLNYVLRKAGAREIYQFRIFAALVSMVGLLSLYLILRRFGLSAKAALCSIAYVGVTPAFLYSADSIEFSAYDLMAFFVAIIAFLHASRSRTNAAKWLHVAAAVLLVLNTYWLVPAYLLFVVCWNYLEGKRLADFLVISSVAIVVATVFLVMLREAAFMGGWGKMATLLWNYGRMRSFNYEMPVLGAGLKGNDLRLQMLPWVNLLSFVREVGGRLLYFFLFDAVAVVMLIFIAREVVLKMIVHGLKLMLLLFLCGFLWLALFPADWVTHTYCTRGLLLPMSVLFGVGGSAIWRIGREARQHGDWAQLSFTVVLVVILSFAPVRFIMERVGGIQLSLDIGEIAHKYHSAAADPALDMADDRIEESVRLVSACLHAGSVASACRVIEAVKNHVPQRAFATRLENWLGQDGWADVRHCF
jgi:hypothetical protein